MARHTKRSVRQSLVGLGFAAPYLVLLIAFGLIPAGYAIYESLTSFPIMSDSTFGIENYTTVFEDFRFWPAVKNVATFMAIWIPIMVGGALFFALLLHERISKVSSTMRLIYFLPGAVTGSAAVLLWYFMLHPKLSPFAPQLRAMGWETGNEVFTASHLAPIFALVAFTTGVGQWIVIMFGALQSIPHDVIEAARVDGAGPIQIALRIKLPMVSKYIVYMLILSFAAGLQIFVEPALFYSITNAGSDWWALNQLGYSFAFRQGEFGQAATVSVALLVVSAIAALVFVTRSNFFETEADQ